MLLRVSCGPFGANARLVCGGVCDGRTARPTRWLSTLRAGSRLSSLRSPLLKGECSLKMLPHVLGACNADNRSSDMAGCSLRRAHCAGLKETGVQILATTALLGRANTLPRRPSLGVRLSMRLVSSSCATTGVTPDFP